MKKYLVNDDENISEDDIIDHISEVFSEPIENLAKYIVVIYDQSWYSHQGDCYILLQEKETGKYFEVVAGHCSCYGFEDQFRPTESSLTYLLSEKNPKRKLYGEIYESLPHYKCEACDELFLKKEDFMIHIDIELEKGILFTTAYMEKYNTIVKE